MFAASKTAPPAGGAPDPQFNYVTMLLHGDGTNGAQNNTFLDSSSNAFTITRNGNTTQGSFSPYGSGWSNYFDGTGDSFNVGAASNWAFMSNSTALWTVEAWVYLSPYSNEAVLVDTYGGSSSNIGMSIRFLGNSLRLQMTRGSSGTYVINSEVNVGIVGEQWFHVAVTYDQSLSSSNMKIYVNGVNLGSGSKTANAPSASNPTYAIRVGDYNPPDGGSTSGLDGYISNLRITNTIVYNANFTPSTTPLTAISGTVLLTCQSNRFVDNSSNAYAITINGTPSVQRFNPFGASTAYSTSVIGGSGYFDGSGTLDYLSASGNSINIRTTVYTMEAWCYFQNPSSFYNEIFVGTLGSGTFQMVYNASSGRFYVSDAVTDIMNPLLNLAMNTWYHIALSFDGTTYKLFVNGVQQASTTTLLANQTITTLKVGGGYNGSITGYISDARVLKGTALYTTTFTPPTAPLTAIANTSLLLNMTNAAIYDNAEMNDLETVGNAQISTSVKKYGTGSMYFNGATDYLKASGSPDLSFGTGDFTIEMWVYRNSNAYAPLITIGQPSGTSGAGLIFYPDTSKLGFLYYSGSNILLDSTTFTNNQWNHVALVRQSGTVYLYINGTQKASASFTTSWNSVGYSVWVGSWFGDGSFPLSGYIDDLRITKGYARYTTTFTPPTAAFPNTGPN